ncbi:TetR/AcrR family transcriptional regulator C-terminal domain-containing protein [Paenibacillus barcinonensis]|uniref:TetR family transcriptional regulator n=1 Tax=Paenibacillus barcinonensis TaxID=198119 RepID=A0A2V4VA46_PAEBA|nr:TetR/AcrR family transcriptional regulator C-terminal domain-containing protein [Paenibacillus barcinonensis]PYE49795.1 TetR family transcriptional regulator [Paenibacillus barcinonensis]QKS56523.1 TetR/AcrR family transcriptional regulator C-terminal domain-containing protein [Paenibacillus barcinonensis]
MLEEDIRIMKSREAIVQAMDTLLKQKPFRKITVNDICRTAVVGRTTFYAHFEDKYKLISYIMQQEARMLEEIILNSPPEEVILEVLLDIRDNKKLYVNLFVEEVPEELKQLLQRTFNLFFTNILHVCREEGVVLASESLPPLVAYYTSGVVGMLMWWFETDFAMPAEELVSCLSKLLGFLWEE